MAKMGRPQHVTVCQHPDCGVPLVSRQHPGPIPAGHKRHYGRGLCSTCYPREKAAGRIQQWISPKAKSCREGGPMCPTCEDAAWLYETKTDPATWARRIGTTDVSLARLLYNHNRRELARPINRIIDARRRAAEARRDREQVSV